MDEQRTEILLAVIAEELYLVRIDREATDFDEVDEKMRDAKVSEITALRRRAELE